MVNTQELDAMRARLRAETEDVIKEVGDLVDEVSKDYATLSALPPAEAQAAVTDIVTAIVFESVKLPWYIPQPFAKGILSSVIAKLVAAKKAGA